MWALQIIIHKLKIIIRHLQKLQTFHLSFSNSLWLFNKQHKPGELNWVIQHDLSNYSSSLQATKFYEALKRLWLLLAVPKNIRYIYPAGAQFWIYFRDCKIDPRSLKDATLFSNHRKNNKCFPLSRDSPYVKQLTLSSLPFPPKHISIIIINPVKNCAASKKAIKTQ